ncbi:MAG: DUF2442 domain-containing protein [Firmicutes bacterium]|jgi:hypothetical protein|nr:DUF2442 domain-containing protein [Bacillota bacterium]
MLYYVPSVIRVIPKENFHVEVLFDNGRLVDYDVTPLLDEEEYRPLQEPAVFMNTCKVLGGTLAWDLTGKNDPDDCLDIDPFMLYECPAKNEDFIFMGTGIID